LSWSETIREHQDVLAKCEPLSLKINDISRVIKKTLDRGSRVVLCGNGGSFAQAQHFAAELVVRYKVANRPPFAAYVLGSNPAVTSAICNDLNPVQIFSRELAASWRCGDCLVALSTSGRSPNIIETIKQAGAMVTIGLTGKDGMALPVDYEFRVPSHDTAIIQQIHQIAIHAICDQVEMPE
jgi:phosphoheptose isomerase